jgi:putative restriction endonuclease
MMCRSIFIIFRRHTCSKLLRQWVDWIVYYEPRRSTRDALSRGGRQSYFAIAEVSGVRPDNDQAEHFYADVCNYLTFDQAVPFKDGDFYYESQMRGPDGRTNPGSAQRAVRNMSDREFDLIVKSGFAETVQLPQSDTLKVLHGFSEPQSEFVRPLVETTITRPFRDAAFARQIQTAYDKKCAMTGLRIINGGGRPEAQAAHIRPVASLGSDSIRNGISLSSTFHWMFDRGLVSIDDSFNILKAKSALPEQVERMINPSGILHVPEDVRLQPHRQFLRFHRENIFKG